MNGTTFRVGLWALGLVAVAVLPAATRADESIPRPHIVVGSELDYPPYAQVTKDGQADGFSVDLMKAVCETMGIGVTFRVGPWSEMRAALENGDIDALPLVSYSKERARVFDFTLPHTVAHGVIFKRRETPGIDSVADLRDKAIIAMRADAGYDWLKRNDISNDLILTPTVEEALKLLTAGKGDYALAPRLVGLLTLRKLGLQGIEITGPLIDAYGRGYGFAVKKGNTPLLLQLNEGLHVVKETGQYNALYDKWFSILDPRGVPPELVSLYVQWGMAAVFVLGILALAWISILRHTVWIRTRELRAARDDLERQVIERTHQLRDKNFILDAVIDGSADAIFVKDREDRFILVNPTMTRYFDTSAAELLGKTDADILPPEIAAETSARTRRVIATGVADEIEEVVRFGGEERIVHTYKTPFRDSEGNIVGVIGISRDISERQRSEAALRESEARLRAVFENVPICLNLKDVDGRYLFVNEPYLEWIGRPAGDVLGKTGQDVYPDNKAVDRLTENEAAVVRTGRVVDDEFPVEMRGKLHYRRVIKFPVKAEDGTVIGIGTAAMDITERKQSEAILRALAESGGAAGGDVLRFLVRQLAVSQDKRCVFVARVSGDLTTSRTVAVWDDGGFAENFSYELAGTPCGDVAEKTACYYPRDVQKLFPGETLLTAMGAESYWGTPLRDSTGKVIGLLAVVDDKPTEETPEFLSLLNSFAVRAAAEMERRRLEERYSVLFREMLDGMAVHEIILDDAGRPVDYRFVSVNPAFESLTGLSAETIVGKTILEVLPETESQWIETYGRVATTGEPVHSENFSGGLDKYFEVLAFRPQQGQLATLFRDVTERKRTEAALRESEVRMRLLLGGVAVGIGVEDLNGRTLSPNEGLARMLGYTPDEVLAMHFTEYTHPGDAGQDADLFREMAAGRRDGYQLEKRYITKDGRMVWGRLTRTVVRDDDGTPLYCLGMLEDITDRKQAEAALRESEERFAKAFRASPAPMSISLIDSGVTLDVNDEWLRMLGFTREEAIGKTSAELGAWAGATPRATFIGRLKRDGSFRNFEATVMTKDGRERQVVLAAETIDQDRMLLVFHDITERLDMERRLAHAQKMEAVGQLTGGIAHDFNNLLQVMMINLELTQDRLADDAQGRRHVNAAIAAGQRGAKLTQQLLSFSRQQVLRPSTVDPNRLVKGMLDMLARTLGEDVEIETRLADGLPPIVVDPHGLENAILNLAVNARAAMPKGGRLTVRTGRRRLDRDLPVEEETLPAGDYVEIAIADTGCGMATEVLAHAFEPFYTTKDVGAGSGLGLSMIYGFTRQSGGHVTLESVVGKGTTATILLPGAAAGNALGASSAGQPDAYDGGHRVLIVEDDPDVLAATALMLKTCGCDVREAEDGMSALAILDEDPTIELLFSDVVMPRGMNGVELAGEAVRRRADLRVILTSGYPDAALAKSGVADEGFRLLRKPFTKAGLLQALAAVFAPGDGADGTPGA